MPPKRTPPSRPPTTKTTKTDILMSIKPEHMSNIAIGRKNHEYRRYLLPATVRRVWLYTTAPVSRIEHVARVSRAKTPGQVPEDGGLGNAEFNAGRKASKYAYEILDLWKLREPMSLKGAMARGFLRRAPQKYCWAPVALVEGFPLGRQEHLLSRDEGGRGSSTERGDTYRIDEEISGKMPGAGGVIKASESATTLVSYG
ncbi:hypothetical protein BJX61DRAFT_100816 [Aspergillus egyptiacus]|nr:hypothetical protein BJX61DRAFT_100816 [Aspergillus egyptiacus]